MLQKRKVLIPYELILVISGMPGTGKSTLALNMVKKYTEFRSLNQLNLLRFAVRYFNDDSDNYKKLKSRLRFQSHEEGKKHMAEITPVLKAFMKRQLEKKIPTVIEGTDLYPPFLSYSDPKESFLENVLCINLYCSEESVHYSRLIEREKQRQRNPSRVDSYFKNIRDKNNLVYKEVQELDNDRIKNIDVAFLSKDHVVFEVENMIELYRKSNHR